MKLFQTHEVTFSVVLILIYVVGSSVMQRISEVIGVRFLAEMLFCLLLTAVLLGFIRKHRLWQYLGLQKPAIPASRMMFYLPLLLLGTLHIFFGVGMEYPLVTSILHTLMMICVGFLEEVIFRGFLFRGIAGQNLTRAVVISSLTFGIGHFVNLFNGSQLLDNCMQVIYAVAVGFLLVLIFLRTSSILPCILFHAVNNCMTAFATGGFLAARLGEQRAELVVLGIRLAIAAACLLYVIKLPERELPER